MSEETINDTMKQDLENSGQVTHDRRSVLAGIAASAVMLGTLPRGARAQTPSSHSGAMPPPMSPTVFGPLSPYGYMYTVLLNIKPEVADDILPWWKLHAQETADFHKRAAQIFQVWKKSKHPLDANYIMFKEDVQPTEDSARAALMKGRPGSGRPDDWAKKYPYATSQLLPGHVTPHFTVHKAIGAKVFPTGYGIDPKLTGLRLKWGLGGKFRQIISLNAPAGVDDKEFEAKFAASAGKIVNDGHLSAQPFVALGSPFVPGGDPLAAWGLGRYTIMIETNRPAVDAPVAHSVLLDIGATEVVIDLQAIQPKCFWDGII